MANIVGTNGDDILVGTGARDTITGLDGADSLHGGAGADTLDGGAGSDTTDYAGDFGMIWVDLASGVGQWNAAQGDIYIGIENISGTEYNDRIFGDSGANRLWGNGGNDALWGGDGADILDGGAGTDTLDFAGDSGAVAVDLGLGIGTAGSAAGDTYTGIENITGSVFDDRLTGDAGINRIDGGDGGDWLDGGDGADILIGGANGVTKHDTADYSRSPGPVWVELTNNLTGFGRWNWAEGDSLSEVEDLIGSAFDDLLIGTGAGAAWRNNRLYGGDGNDELHSGGGFADELFGGNGNDKLVGHQLDTGTIFHGGAGADRMEGVGALDLADYSDSSGAVWVNLGTGQGFWNDAEGDTLFTIENLRGSLGNDLLYGDDGANVIYGGDGNDNIGGGGGADTLDGSTGADTIDGGAGSDTLDFSGAFGGVSVSLRANVGYWNAAEGDLYANVENVKGTAFNDYFEGNDGANTFAGNGGDDLFTVRSGFGTDVITDFVGNGSASGDRIQFTDGMFANFADLTAHSSQVGGNVVITLGANTLTLQNVSLASLHASDFLFL